MWGAGAGWLTRLLGGGRIRVHEIHQERNPFFGGVNPEPIRPNVDEALRQDRARTGHELGLLLDGDADRAGAADEQGRFIHQLEVTGLLMYYLAEHRGLREPVVVSVNNTSMAERLGKHYGIEVIESPVGYKFIGPIMIETRRDDGRRGIRWLRLRDAPARSATASTRTCSCSTCSSRRGARQLAAVEDVAQFHELAGPSFYRRVDVHVDRAIYGETKRRLLEGLVATPPTALAGAAGRPHPGALDTNDGFKFFVDDGSWLLIRTSGHGAARPRLHGGHLGERARRARRAGEKLVRG